MTFEWPLALLGLLVVPLLVALHVLRERRRTEYTARFASPALVPNLVERTPGWRRHAALVLVLAALAAMVVGVARPHASLTVRRHDATVVLAIDVSRSMASKDVKPTRLDAARGAAVAFLAKVPSTYRVALVSFATRAVIAVPPTLDRAVIEDGIAQLRLGAGTALGDAIDSAIDAAPRSGAHGSPLAVLLISDGTQTTGRTTPAVAATRARNAHVPVYTISLGTPGGVVERPLPGGLKELTRVPPDPETLQQVARRTGAEFFTAPTDRRLTDVFTKLGSRLAHERKPREISDLFAAGAAGLLLVGGALSTAWFRRPV